MLKNLSLYGWISALIISILCIIFMAIAFQGPSWMLLGASYTGNNNDDDSQGINDICWNGNIWPNKVWTVSLNNGLCFPSIPDANAVSSSSGLTFGAIFGSDAFNSVSGFKCLPWGGKTKGSFYDLDMYSNNDDPTQSDAGYMAVSCDAFSTANNAADDQISRGSLVCDNFESFANKYQNSASAAKAGVAFGVFAFISSIVGIFYQGKEQQRSEMFQGVAGAFFLLVFLMTIITLGLGSANPNNPYTRIYNVEAFGCFPAYLSGNYEAFSVPGVSQTLTIVTLILSATMGGLCLTFKQCFNPCCCPCCFTVDAPPSTGTPINQGNGDNYGVKV